MEIYFQAGRRTTKGGGGAWASFFFSFWVGLWIVDWRLWILDLGDAKNGIFPFDFFFFFWNWGTPMLLFTQTFFLILDC